MRARDEAGVGSLLSQSTWSRPWRRDLWITGYVQGQYQSSQASEDQLQQSGAPLNDTRIAVRRARLRVDRGWQWASASIELDGNSKSGVVVGLRRAEASLVLRAKDDATPPLAALTFGLFDVPFGHELVESARTRLFAERTLGSRALFPGEPDLGARLSGAVGFVRYAVAFVNGQPVPDDQPGKVLDFTSAKDLVARLGVDAAPHARLRASAGVSFLRGKGFHAGSAATKDAVQWRDTNENGAIDAGELVAVPGVAATASQTFDRWAVGIDGQLRWETPIGWGMLAGELWAASNLDRGFFVADPTTVGADVRESGANVALVHEVTRWALAGVRWDRYDPNADARTAIGGKLLPVDQAVTTWSPLVGVTVRERARLVFQYDFIRDHLGKDERGVPVDLRNDQATLRLQVEL